PLRLDQALSTPLVHPVASTPQREDGIMIRPQSSATEVARIEIMATLASRLTGKYGAATTPTAAPRQAHRDSAPTSRKSMCRRHWYANTRLTRNSQAIARSTASANSP